jgi:hypothetical protein
MSALPKPMDAAEIARHMAEHLEDQARTLEEYHRRPLSPAEMAKLPFHQVVQRLRSVDVCDDCGKSRVLMNSVSRGFRAEKADPAIHCACPGGPAYAGIGSTLAVATNTAPPAAPIEAIIAQDTLEVCERCGVTKERAEFYGDDACPGDAAWDTSGPISAPPVASGEHSWVRVLKDAETPAPAYDGPWCPKCGDEMHDNRPHKRNPKAPDWKCKSRSCDGVIWPAREVSV